jgi:hypothetical protein
VNHRTARNLVGLLMAVALCTSAIIAPVGAALISPVAVNASSTSTGATNVSYSFTFALPLGSGGLDANEAITITFPLGFDVSRVGQTSGSVTCTHYQYWEGQVNQVTVSAQQVRIALSRPLSQGASTTITFHTTAQITNPSIAADYSFVVDAPHDTGSASITIGAAAPAAARVSAGSPASPRLRTPTMQGKEPSSSLLSRWRQIHCCTPPTTT